MSTAPNMTSFSSLFFSSYLTMTSTAATEKTTMTMADQQQMIW
jgi:hypothetical protein